jgi:hypothetical protein
MVEQFDTEGFADYHASGEQKAGTRFELVPERHFSPPLLTKTWFHQGPVDDDSGDWLELDYSAEYFPGDPPALAHVDGVNAFLQTLGDPRHRRDALRTLRGSIQLTGPSFGFSGLSLSTNRRFNLDGIEITGTGEHPPANLLTVALFEAGALSPVDEWTLELPISDSENPFLRSVSATDVEQIDLSEIHDAILVLEYETTPK